VIQVNAPLTVAGFLQRLGRSGRRTGTRRNCLFLALREDNTDGGMLFIGPEAERRFGHRHFMNLMAVFTAPPEFTVLHGRDEIGRVDPSLLAGRVAGPRLLLLGGRSWRVTWTDWKRRRCFVEPAEGGGRARWLSDGVGGLSLEIARSMRDVLLGRR
jgi:ATP-dependent helicase Lhr and Lhr-like helicase